MTRADLDVRFDHHAPDGNRGAKHAAVRKATKHYVSTVLTQLDNPESREVSLYLTKMEEALFWLNAHIARNTDSTG